MDDHSAVVPDGAPRGEAQLRTTGERAGSPANDVAALLDVHGAAQRLGVSVRFVRGLVEQRRMPFLKIGKFVRFDPATLDEWIQTHLVEPV
jgi:excisionase family DNA binding protein